MTHYFDSHVDVCVDTKLKNQKMSRLFKRYNNNVSNAITIDEKIE